MRGRPLPRAKAALYMDKARSFAATARNAHDAARWDPAVSAAAHAAINACDAACVRFLELRSRGPSHDEAIELLESIEAVDADDRARVARNLQSLLQLKHVAEYADRSVRPEEAAAAMKAMERLLDAVEGWAATW